MIKVVQHPSKAAKHYRAAHSNFSPTPVGWGKRRVKVRKLTGQDKNRLTSEGKAEEEREKINAVETITHQLPEIDIPSQFLNKDG